MDEARNNVSLTIVNRGEQEDDLELRLRDFDFEGSVSVQTLTAATGASPSGCLVLRP